ncbi:hypothetical protein D3P07_10930 [Paenibacillus sp. 1011MAR3C5]|uniref:hypothetical protein n=1 Tax=Paenibacillus sp. 1011MAR3C5 TaxID=1675787 RepID=UPI000E6D0943|nr:hypothetical protein [Paenibacillus sp. 1011MAR3C5]RJE88507.1 hypothetical protein D3P07_10930 [Paenibacillus sp. 1011MAR3C5]
MAAAPPCIPLNSEQLSDSAMPGTLRAVCAKASAAPGCEARSTFRIPDGTSLTLRSIRLDDRQGGVRWLRHRCAIRADEAVRNSPLLAKALCIDLAREVTELIPWRLDQMTKRQTKFRSTASMLELSSLAAQHVHKQF